MNLNDTDVMQQARNAARLHSLSSFNFECIESTNFSGFVWQVRCKACGHKLQVNQTAWQIRHWVRCPKRDRTA